MSTGAESFPRRPSPLKVPLVRTSAARGRIKYSTESDGDAAPGRRALATYESAWRADVTQDLRALTTYPGSPGRASSSDIGDQNCDREPASENARVVRCLPLATSRRIESRLSSVVDAAITCDALTCMV